MAAQDFYFAINATFRHLHDRHGRAALEQFWRAMGLEHYRSRWQRWRTGGCEAIARDWKAFFSSEPRAVVNIQSEAGTVLLDIRLCPAIDHLRASGREIVPYFCDHCDHVCGAMAEQAGFGFVRTGGMGQCRQQFVTLRHDKSHSATGEK